MNPAASEIPKMKWNKSEVQFEHPGMGEDKCEDCIHFIPSDHKCSIVKGKVEPKDWCNKFEEDSK